MSTNPTADAITALMEQRRVAVTTYRKLLAEPDSYSISGSVSATNKKLADLREEINVIDTKLKALCSNSDGITRRYPNYNHEVL